MTKQEIAFMMQNGFTIEEIMGICGNHAPEPETPPEPEPETPPKPETPSVKSELETRVDNLVGTVENLVQMMQRNNINGIQFGSPVAERTADDVLAEIINPNPKHK